VRVGGGGQSSQRCCRRRLLLRQLQRPERLQPYGRQRLLRLLLHRLHQLLLQGLGLGGCLGQGALQQRLLQEGIEVDVDAP
jgi:hypothetical protein